MVSRQDARSLIKSAFPGHDSLVDRACRESASFRDLCQDYRNCAVALERWRRLSDDEPSPRVHEYTELLAELAEEIASCLAGMTDGAAPQLRGGGR